MPDQHSLTAQHLSNGHQPRTEGKVSTKLSSYVQHVLTNSSLDLCHVRLCMEAAMWHTTHSIIGLYLGLRLFLSILLPVVLQNAVVRMHVVSMMALIYHLRVYSTSMI